MTAAEVARLIVAWRSSVNARVAARRVVSAGGE